MYLFADLVDRRADLVVHVLLERVRQLLLTAQITMSNAENKCATTQYIGLREAFFFGAVAFTSLDLSSAKLPEDGANKQERDKAPRYWCQRW